MKPAKIEHINLSVSNPDASAQLFCELFAWKVRWSGTAMNNGYTVHVGTDKQYLALYTCDNYTDVPHSGDHSLNLNHIAVTVDDINQIEQAVLDAGLTPFSHANYEPGQRFYFNMHDQLEVEVVSYTGEG